MSRVDDPKRLAALRDANLLDTPREERYDRLTRLAAAALRVPVALISVVDRDRQFFKSAIGLAEPWDSARGTALSHSFCRHVVETEAALVVPNSRAHALVRDNPAIVELGVAAYLGVPLALDDGTVLGAVCGIDNAPHEWTDADLVVLQDIAALAALEISSQRATTLLRAQAEELRTARDAAEAGRRAKDQFLAMISHELRTPLNGVIGLAGLLLDSRLDQSARLQANMLRDAADHLLELINDLLDYSKLDAGRLEFEEQPYAVEAVVQGALDLMASRAHAKGLEIGAFISPDVPPLLLGDGGRLRRVLLNLLGNAVKFTTSGSVMLDVGLAGCAAGGCELEFAISDTGPGIPPDMQPLLFEEFSQLGGGAARRQDGTGLGLAICRRLVRRMGGDITVASEPAVGSVFRFTIRQPVVEPAPGSQPRGQARLAGERVLVLSASAAAGDLLCRQVSSRGGRAQRAVFGAVGLRALRLAAEEGAPFHACIIDQGLPGEGADAFAAGVRAEPQIAATRLVLVGTTEPRTGPDDAARRLFDAWLLKPAPVDTLIFRLLGTTPPRAADPAPAAPARPSTLRVLVAEDNATNQAVIRGLLGKLGHRADIVLDGHEAVRAVAERPYDLIFMDVMMPGLDGVDATRRIRTLAPPAGTVPILALTADAFTQNHRTYLEAGMQGVLTKPVTLQALRDAIARLPDAAGELSERTAS